MSPLQLMWHALWLAWPAVFMALCMPSLGRWVMGPGGGPWRRRVLAHGALALATLLAGLWWQGHDGRMATYGAMVVLAASLEWALHRPWRRTRP